MQVYCHVFNSCEYKWLSLWSYKHSDWNLWWTIWVSKYISLMTIAFDFFFHITNFLYIPVVAVGYNTEMKQRLRTWITLFNHYVTLHYTYCLLVRCLKLIVRCMKIQPLAQHFLQVNSCFKHLHKFTIIFRFKIISLLYHQILQVCGYLTRLYSVRIMNPKITLITCGLVQ